MDLLKTLGNSYTVKNLNDTLISQQVAVQEKVFKRTTGVNKDFKQGLRCTSIDTTISKTKNTEMRVDCETLGKGNDTITTKLIMI